MNNKFNKTLQNEDNIRYIPKKKNQIYHSFDFQFKNIFNTIHLSYCEPHILNKKKSFTNSNSFFSVRAKKHQTIYFFICIAINGNENVVYFIVF